MEKIKKSNEEWKRILTPEQYRVMRMGETESPFSCALEAPNRRGTYRCAACGLPLFLSEERMEEKKWPSFFRPFSPENVEEWPDRAEAHELTDVRRIEVVCARCGSHLGHVFSDGPPPLGKRYCINYVALKLDES